MNYPKKFIKATHEYNTLEKNVPAPYIRKSFISDVKTTAKLIIAACGFYELYVNGAKYTKGFFAPYISNPDHYIYCDEYEVTIDEGENVIGILLGNGFQNNPGGYIWDFDKAAYRSAPMVAVRLEYKDKNNEKLVIESDSSFKTHFSPIRSDDYRFGEYYDANYEIKGWNEKGFDDSEWSSVTETRPPRGTLKLCSAEPIKKETELKPVKVIKEGESYVYDFGMVNAGICRLNISGAKGQKIEMRFGEILHDGKFFINNMWFVRDFWKRDKNIVHRDTYICSGAGHETYTPTFTYHGFRYVKVTGITEEQANESLLTYLVIHSDIKTCGGFTCSDDVVNKLQEITRRSDISNFHYFPTDCPQREKNGWTADAALSCEHMLLNYEPEHSYREWLNNIRKAQNEKGALPGIIPTSGWGYEYVNGPAWDCVLAYLPYYVYKYRGKTEMIKESTHAFIAYLHYLSTQTDSDGLVHFGLGDWCHVGGLKPPKAPLEVTDTIMSMDIADKMSFMFGAVGCKAEQEYAKSLALNYRNAIRKNLIDFDTMLVAGNCQSSQAMCIYYNIFEPNEVRKAFQCLLDLIHKENDHMDVGVLGGRVIFHVLSKFNYSDLALKMIARPDFPSYGNLIERGATTLWESFLVDRYESTNHHFWGDISAWFIKCLAGIQFNPNGNDINRLEIRPSFVDALDSAEGFYDAPSGRIVSSWKKEDIGIILSLSIPESIDATAILAPGFVFDNGASRKKVCSGEYKIIRI